MMSFKWLAAALLLVGVALGSTNANAALLFAGGEDTDFTCNANSTCTVNTNSSSFRPAWARESYGTYGSTSDPAYHRFSTPTFTPSTTLWIHGRVCYDNCVSNNQTANGSQMLRVMDSIGNATLLLRGTGTSGQLYISSRTAGGTFTNLATCTGAAPVALSQLDFFVNYGTSGEVTLYANGAQVCDFVGNVTNGDGASTLDAAEFSGVHTNFATNWSEIIIATTDTRAMSRFSAYTFGNGSATNFSGTNVCSAIWNSTAYNDASYGYSGSSNVIHECTVHNTLPAGSFNVLGLVTSARVLAGTSGPQHFDFVTRTGGTDYPSADYAPPPAFSNIGNYIQTTNPATSAAWAISDFTAADFNVGEETKP